MRKSRVSTSPTSATRSKSVPSRSAIIIKSGVLFILVNFILAALNLVIGQLSGSIAIISDSLHSLVDAISGFLIILSEKLAKSHKFGAHRVKIERLTTILIAIIIIAVGVHVAIESFEALIDPEPLDVTPATFAILLVSIILKLSLSIYLKRAGASHRSAVLAASGAETLNDTWISVAVLVSTIIYAVSHLNVEGYIGLLVALIIIKVGLEFIFPHISSHHHHPLEQDSDHDHCGGATSS